MEKTIKERVHAVVEEHLGVSISADDANLDDLGADSLDRVELLMAFEEKFTISIDDDSAEEVNTVADAVILIENLCEEQGKS